MENSWPLIPLADLVERNSPITYGVVKPGIHDSSGIKFIRGGDIINGEIQIPQLRTISLDISNQYKRTLLKGGELLISLVGNPGQVAIVPESLSGANIARQVGLVRLKNNIDVRYIKYFLMSPPGQESLRTKSIGSVQQVINLSDLKEILIPFPPLPVQQKIASILGALDDKIELNRRMNKTLEDISQTLFRHWFVENPEMENWPTGKITDICLTIENGGTPKRLESRFGKMESFLGLKLAN